MKTTETTLGEMLKSKNTNPDKFACELTTKEIKEKIISMVNSTEEINNFSPNFYAKDWLISCLKNKPTKYYSVWEELLDFLDNENIILTHEIRDPDRWQIIYLFINPKEDI